MIKEGTKVEWEWGNGTASGKVEEIHREKVTRSLDGSEVTRDGSDDDPAYLIKQDDDAEVLKLQSEVKRAD
ncbi:MAG: DUF2945 domain-containing protein [Verrucomicrobiales bacterium]|nr:DUF2945 domain-containing protein [Verrucomicrobiales bacterium]